MLQAWSFNYWWWPSGPSWTISTLLLPFVLSRASLRRTTAVCLKPPDIESRFELALGRAFVAIATVLGGERRCLYVLLVIDDVP